MVCQFLAAERAIGGDCTEGTAWEGKGSGSAQTDKNALPVWMKNGGERRQAKILQTYNYSMRNVPLFYGLLRELTPCCKH